MKLLEERILKDGKVYPGNVLKVSGFLNHLIDIDLLDAIGKDITAHFCEQKITKILTIEASGIAIACAVAHYMHTPVLFAKKSKTTNVSDNCYKAEVVSYTHNTTSTVIVEKQFINSDDVVLIVDDFLANGAAVRGLKSLVEQAGATLAGCAIAIEKGFQKGGADLRAAGVNVYSLAIVDSMTDDSLVIRQQD